MIHATDSKNTYYLINQKKGIPIVLIHGVGLNLTIWEPQLDAFNNTVIAYDILGHGNTSLDKSNINFDDFSNQLLNLIDNLNLKKIHLVGFSIGSLIARNFACKFNERLQSLTLLCTIFKRSKEEQQVINDRFELAKKSNGFSRETLKRWFTDDYMKKNPEVCKKILSILSKNNIENFLKIYSLFVNHKDDEDFQKITTKTLVLTGEEDPGSTPAMSKNLSKVIKNSKCVIAKGKHLCGIEHSDEVNKAIKDHIENV